MKSISMLALLLAIYSSSFAQPPAALMREPNLNKKQVFTDQPQRSKIKVQDLESLLDLPVGASVNTYVSGNLRITGKVVSKSDPVDRQFQSVVVRLSNRERATFTFSKRVHADGKADYTGRVFSLATGDAMEIKKENAGYVLLKKGSHELVTE